MTKWECVLCGYIFEAEWPMERCPRCGASRDKFKKIED
jgi:rubredoxin